MLQRVRNLAGLGLRTVDNLLTTFDHKPVRVARWALKHAADLVDPPPVPIHHIPDASRRAPDATPHAETIQPPPAVEAAELVGALAGHLIVDVREPQETEGGIIPGALTIPMRDVPSRIGELRDGGKPVVVYCAHGIRSANVVTHLRDRGVEAVTLRGGVEAWRAAGGELVTP